MKTDSTMKADVGMRMVLDMIKASYIAQLMEGNDKICLVMLSAGANHTERNGKPYEYSAKMVEELQGIITQIGTDLMHVTITQQPQTQADSPLCYGEDMVSKFKVLGKVIKHPYLFVNVLSKTEKWRKMHLSQKDSQYYNQFTDGELGIINNGIRTIALKLCSIHLQTNKD